MFRRHPDAVALAVLGFCISAAQAVQHSLSTMRVQNAMYWVEGASSPANCVAEALRHVSALLTHAGNF